MAPKTANEIRKSFIDFFEKKQHLFVPSSPVAPQDDPTLMFINAGMNQFKSIFLGDNPKRIKRAANSQKCIRVSGKHNDLDEVGRDTYHHTLFEMLGNWSFGDYYKKEAIEFAWELLTEVWGLDKNRIFVTYYQDDAEAAELWKKVSGLPASRIMPFDEKDNFWEMGETGPCGPCSEIHYDKGDLSSQEDLYNHPIKGVNGENDRFIEIWNLVFMQYNRSADGTLNPLKDKHVDTGMGFERICAILQDKRSNYDTDVFAPIIAKIAEFSGVAYLPSAEGMPHRVIADHLRAVSFAIADGVMPANEGRGYVMRRILRRASRYARQLGQESAFIYKLVPLLSKLMGEAFPEIAARQDFVSQVIKAEEDRFTKTLGTGLDRFAKIVEEMKKSGSKVVEGEKVFVLYDTFGFPSDLTRIIAEDEGLSIDENGFEVAMQKQKDRARAARKTGVDIADEDGWNKLNHTTGTKFLGYEAETAPISISRYRKEGDDVYFVASETPFYAEAGGQVGESGLLDGGDLQLKVLDTTKINDSWVHRAEVIDGLINDETMAAEFIAIVNPEARIATKANHSATHILHAALRELFGEHISQQGSRVDHQGLRFDFSHHSALNSDDLKLLENRANEAIRANYTVETKIQDLAEAKASGAMALFGEKYDEKVRVVSMSAFSIELCGGLHVNATGEIGVIKIISESSVAAGVRRIEAISGEAAIEFNQSQEETLKKVVGTLKTKPDKVLHRVESLVSQNKLLEKELERLQQQLANQKMDSLLEKVEEFNGIPVLIHSFKGMDKKEFASMVDSMAGKHKGVALLTNVDSTSGSIAVTVAKSLTQRVKAGNLIKEISAIAGGKGGGRPDRAQAGTKEPEKIPDAIAGAKKIILGALA
jgi:alanyl-tRNA synthetase